MIISQSSADVSANPFESPVEATTAEEVRTCPECGQPMARGLVRNSHIAWDDHSRSWLGRLFLGCRNLTPVKWIQLLPHKIPGYYCAQCQLLTLDLDPKKR